MENSTLQIVGNISLSIFFGIVVGVVLAPVIAYVDQSFRKNDAFTKTNYLLIVSWALVPIFTIYFAYTLFSGHYDTAKALAPLGMMIAAMIASASVMKNIAETKKNEADKHAKEASKFHLDKCTEGLEHVYNILSDKNNDHNKWGAAANSLITILELSENITEPHHKHFFEIEKSKYCLKLYKLYSDINEFFFTGSTIWRDNGSSNAFTRSDRFKERVEKAGSAGCAKNIDPLVIRVIFSLCTDSLNQKVSDIPLVKWKKTHSEITENELSWWEAHDILKHAVPLIKFFQEKNQKDQ